MSVVRICQKGEDVLGKKCHEVTKFDRRLHLLLRDMAETLEEANGVGLAAPQVGILRRIFLVSKDGEITAYINPVILEKSGEQEPVEGCLSLPGVWGKVIRPTYVRLKAQDKDGNWFEDEGYDLIAEAFDHENDHLDGVLFDSKITEYVDMESDEDDQ